MQSFKRRMGTGPQDAYLKLDVDGDGFLHMGDFTGANAAGVFSPPLAVEQAEYAFNGLDANRDSVVCVAEFFGTLRLGAFFRTAGQLESIGAVIRAAPGRPQQEASGFAVAAEPSGAFARPSLKPLVTVAQFRARMRPASAQEAHETIDADEDGTISLGEYRGRARDLFAPPLTPTEVEYTFRGFDADADGKISSSEFFGALRLGHFFQTPQALQAAGERDTPPAPAPAPLPRPTSAPITEAGFVERMRTSFASPQAAYEAISAGASGGMDFDDFVRGSQKFAQPLGHAEAMYAFKGFDSDGDHRITRAEFFGTLNIGHFFQTPEAVRRASAFLDLPEPRKERRQRRFDCDDSLQEWEFEWSKEKQAWCCHEEHKGCSSKGGGPRPAAGPAPTTPRPGAAHDKVDKGEQVEAPRKGPHDRGGGSSAGKLPPGADAAHAAPVKLRSIRLDEFIKRVRSKYASPQDAFKLMDVDGDAVASVAEFSNATASFAEPLTQQEAEYAFAGLDANGDGFVAASEFFGTLQVGKLYATSEQFKAAGITLDSSVHTAAASTAPPTPAPAPAAPPAPPAPTPAPAPAPTAAPAPAPAPTAAPAPAPAPKWERQAAPIDVGDFRRRMGDAVPGQLSALSATPGGCVDLAIFRASALAFTPPLSREEADYAFCGMDVDYDKRVCAGEFRGVLAIGHFFPSSEHLRRWREAEASKDLRPRTAGAEPTTAPTTTVASAPTTTAKFAVPGRAVSADDLEQYRGVPAIVNGHTRLRVPGGALTDAQLQQLGGDFRRAMREVLALRVTVAVAKRLAVPSEAGEAEAAEFLWTAGSSPDGGSLQIALRDHGRRVEAAVKAASTSSERRSIDVDFVWGKVVFAYYGPYAASLPMGEKLTQEFGRVGSTMGSASGSSPYVAAPA